MDRKHLLSTSILTGLLAGLIPSTVLTLWMTLSPYEASVETVAVTVLCMEVMCAALWGTRHMLIYLAVIKQDMAGCVLYQNQPQQDEPEGEPEEEHYEEEEEYEGPVPLTTQVMRAAYLQVEWKYRHGEDPTRKKMMSRSDMSQPMWNSGRDVVKVMGLVDDSGTWTEVGWEQVNEMFLRIKPEEEQDRLWVPTLNSRGLRPIRVTETLQNNRHTEVPTTLLGSV